MRRTLLFCTALALAIACGESPTSVPEGSEPFSGELVITAGVAAPAQAPRGNRPSMSEVASATASLGGSSTTPLSLTPQSCSETASQQVVVTYTITGNQAGTATFDVATQWSYNGTWVGSAPMTVSVPPRAGGAPATVRTVTLTVTNASSADFGSSSFIVAPSNLTNSNATGAKLAFVATSNVTVYVAFTECAVTNTAPTLVLPADITAEATSSAGAVVNFLVTANDLEDGPLTPTCNFASGSTFPLGATTVSCSVTDTDGETTSGSFDVTVVDTTPADFTSFPTGTVNLIAADITGAVLDIDALGITVEDFGNVSEPSTFECDYVAGTKLVIGSTTTVSCTASDAIGNESDPARTFDVFVGLNVSASGFLPPLRMIDPFSLHKRGSTIPHKFLPPTYANGTPATDLAAGLQLVLKRIDGTVDYDDIPVNDYSAGSTIWRFEDGQYIFNLKTGTTSPWDPGTWKTTVSYAGIQLAMTQFDLRK